MSQIQISTSLGEIVVMLYDDTPQHRDNFIRLIQEGYYDGTLFHRVIAGFMIQGGDPYSKDTTRTDLGIGGPGYELEAEILPHHFHKRGALAAARLGDEVNPEKRSSGSQFYIVWGEVYHDDQLRQLEKQLMLQAEQQAFDALKAEHRDLMMNLRRQRDREGLATLQDQLIQQAKAVGKKQGRISEEAHKVYTTQGGVPFLDGAYTVFGEVISGLEVVERIQQVETGFADRPVEDVVMKIHMIETV